MKETESISMALNQTLSSSSYSSLVLPFERRLRGELGLVLLSYIIPHRDNDRLIAGGSIFF